MKISSDSSDGAEDISFGQPMNRTRGITELFDLQMGNRNTGHEGQFVSRVTSLERKKMDSRFRRNDSFVLDCLPQI